MWNNHQWNFVDTSHFSNFIIKAVVQNHRWKTCSREEVQNHRRRTCSKAIVELQIIQPQVQFDTAAGSFNMTHIITPDGLLAEYNKRSSLITEFQSLCSVLVTKIYLVNKNEYADDQRYCWNSRNSVYEHLPTTSSM